MSHRALLAAAGAQGKLYSEDVFSAYPYAGNGGTQTIATGVDLAGNGGLVWIKGRTSAGYSNYLTDTVRGGGKSLITDATNSELVVDEVTSFSNSGFSVGNYVGSNASGQNYASWTFRRAARFFDVVTWTGDGTSNRQIPHALGIAPGMVTAKRRDAAGDWAVWHRSATGDLYLDTTAAQTGSFTQITAASATTFSVSGNANILNATYVAYAWAHDPDTVNGIVQCGSFTTDGSGTGTVNLGYEPQYVMVKNAGSASGWLIVDAARGFLALPSTADPYLATNTSSAEAALGGSLAPMASGFTMNNIGGGTTWIYLAIRRGPMRTPTSGTQVYNAIARTGTGAAASVTGVGFAPDLLIGGRRNTSPDANWFFDQLRGPANANLQSSSAAAELTTSAGRDVSSFSMDGCSVGAGWNTGINSSGIPIINWFFRRAPGFFDIACYKGTSANQTLSHNLGAVPKMMWIKNRAEASDWAVYHSALGPGSKVFLDSTAAVGADSTYLNSTAPTVAGFTVGVNGNTNVSGDNYIAYLFGELAGVSKIGTYTGNGSTQTINCGFASGARFVLIKRTDAVGDWLVLDTVRGIISGNDPYLALDTATAEVTNADLLTPQSVGFGLTSNALVNANGGSYIYFSVA